MRCIGKVSTIFAQMISLNNVCHGGLQVNHSCSGMLGFDQTCLLSRTDSLHAMGLQRLLYQQCLGGLWWQAAAEACTGQWWRLLSCESIDYSCRRSNFGSRQGAAYLGSPILEDPVRSFSLTSPQALPNAILLMDMISFSFLLHSFLFQILFSGISVLFFSAQKHSNFTSRE